jgi:hypothetical protein
MKYARIVREGEIVEFFESENIESKINSELLSTLIKVSDDSEIGDYVIDGKNVGKKPSEDFEYKDKKWVKKKSSIKKETFEEKLLELKALELASDATAAETRAVVRKILEILKERF